MENRFSLFEKIYLPIAVGILCVSGWYFHSGWLVILCTVLGMTGSVLNGTGRRACYFFLLASSLMYACISLTTAYYGEAILHFAVVSPLFAYSILRWFRPGKGQDAGEMHRLSGKSALLLLAGFLAGAFAYSFFLRAIGTREPLLNAASTAAALAANLLSARRMKEQWYAQLFSNAALIALWLAAADTSPENLPLLVQNVLFIVSNIRGAVLWGRNAE